MKKILLLMAIILPFVLTSCGDDKDEPKSLEQQLIGSWVLTEVYGPNTLIWHYIFNSDHNGKKQIYLNEQISTEEYFTWSLKGNILSCSFLQAGNMVTVNMEISIDGDVLHIKEGEEIFELHRAKG